MWFTALNENKDTVTPNHQSGNIVLDDLESWTAGFYASRARAPEDEEAVEELYSFVRREPPMLKVFDNLEECTEYLGGPPVLSRFGVLTRVKDGKVKKRVILDEKQSMITLHTKKTHRVLLPRVSDATQDALDLSDGLRSGEKVEQMVLDAKDAFWTVPNHPSERRFCVGKVRGKFLVYLRTPQGSRGAPFSWGYIFAFVMRCTQSLFEPSQVRLQAYVDDPLATIRGTATSSPRGTRGRAGGVAPAMAPEVQVPTGVQWGQSRH